MQWHAHTICLSNSASLSCTLWRHNDNITKESSLRCHRREPRLFHHHHNYTSLVMCQTRRKYHCRYPSRRKSVLGMGRLIPVLKIPRCSLFCGKLVRGGRLQVQELQSGLEWNPLMIPFTNLVHIYIYIKSHFWRAVFACRLRFVTGSE